MMTADMIRNVPLAELDELVRSAWSAVGAGHLDEGTAQAISEAAQARRSAARVKGAVAQRKALSAFPGRRKRTVSRDRQASIHRRRSLAASGMIPARIAASFTTGELAALTVIAVEVMRRGRCELAIDHLAALAGVGRTTAQNALRLAQRQGLITVSERRRPGRPSLTNVVTVVSQEWAGWISRRGRVQKGEPHVEQIKKRQDIQSADLHRKAWEMSTRQQTYLDTFGQPWANRVLQSTQETQRDERRR